MECQRQNEALLLIPALLSVENFKRPVREDFQEYIESGAQNYLEQKLENLNPSPRIAEKRFS